jgi:hypothetical protein
MFNVILETQNHLTQMYSFRIPIHVKTIIRKPPAYIVHPAWQSLILRLLTELVSMKFEQWDDHKDTFENIFVVWRTVSDCSYYV